MFVHLACFSGFQCLPEKMLGITVIEILAAKPVNPGHYAGPVVGIDLNGSAHFQRQVTAVGAIGVSPVSHHDSLDA